MQYGRFGFPKKLGLIPLVFALALIVACGGTAAEPQVIEKEVIVEREVIKEVPVEKQVVVKEEVIREVIKEVPVDREVIVEREVIREVVVEKVVIATRVPQAPVDLKPAGTLNVGQKELGVYTIHPRLAPNPQIFVQGTAPIGESLLTVNSDLEVVGMLAKSWEVSEDSLTWTFHLEEGVQFHKGYGEMTAEDVIWSFDEFSASTKHPRASNIRGVWNNENGFTEAPDPYTVVVNTGQTWSQVPIWEMTTSPGGSATWIASKKQTEELGMEEANKQIAATGPWDVVGNRTGEFWRMQAVEDHWRKTPAFAELIFWEIPEESSRIAGLQTGQLDTTLIAFDSIPVIEQIEGAELMSFPGGGESALTFYGQYYVGLGTPEQQAGYNPELPWVSASADLDSPEWERARKVRVALSIAIDRQAIVDTLLGGRGGPAVLWDFGQYEDTWLPPEMRWEFDPEKSKQLLAEAGYPDGFNITLTPSLRGAPIEVEACEVIAQMWEDIGVDVKFQRLPYSALRPSLIGRNYHGSTCHAGGIRLEPGQGFSGMLSQSVHGAVWNRGVEHPWLDEMVSRHQGEVNEVARRKLGLEIATFMFDNALTGVGLYNFDVVWPVGPRIQPWLEGVRYRDLRSINGYEYIRPR
jgi:ABC-type transport system substrate-binding protein